MRSGAIASLIGAAGLIIGGTGGGLVATRALGNHGPPPPAVSHPAPAAVRSRLPSSSPKVAPKRSVTVAKAAAPAQPAMAPLNQAAPSYSAPAPAYTAPAYQPPAYQAPAPAYTAPA